MALPAKYRGRCASFSRGVHAVSGGAPSSAITAGEAEEVATGTATGPARAAEQQVCEGDGAPARGDTVARQVHADRPDLVPIVGVEPHKGEQRPQPPRHRGAVELCNGSYLDQRGGDQQVGLGPVRHDHRTGDTEKTGAA